MQEKSVTFLNQFFYFHLHAFNSWSSTWWFVLQFQTDIITVSINISVINFIK